MCIHVLVHNIKECRVHKISFVKTGIYNTKKRGPWSYGSWINNYLCNQCLSLLMWAWISIRTRCTTLCNKVWQWLATGRWFSTGPPVSSTNKTERHDITEILLKVPLNTIKQQKHNIKDCRVHKISFVKTGYFEWYNLQYQTICYKTPIINLPHNVHA